MFKLGTHIHTLTNHMTYGTYDMQYELKLTNHIVLKLRHMHQEFQLSVKLLSCDMQEVTQTSKSHKLNIT